MGATRGEVDISPLISSWTQEGRRGERRLQECFFLARWAAESHHSSLMHKTLSVAALRALRTIEMHVLASVWCTAYHLSALL